MAAQLHQFHAVAFVENFLLKEVAKAFSSSQVNAYELHVTVGNGDAFIYGFGAVVFRNLSDAEGEDIIARLRVVYPRLAPQVADERFTVSEDPANEIGIRDGVFRIDRMTPARAGVVGLTVAQSAAMEYYEKILVRLFAETESLVDRLEIS